MPEFASPSHQRQVSGFYTPKATSLPGSELVFNILLLGDQSVGKSTLSNRFVNKTSSSTSTAYVPTIGVNFFFKNITVDGYHAKLQLWDTAGQNQFMTFLNESYFQQANATILMYDLTKKSSFKEMKLWIEHIRCHCRQSVNTIVGNKLDLLENDGDNRRQVETRQARELAGRFDFDFVEMSSLDQRSVDQLFLQLSRAMILGHLRKQCHQMTPVVGGAAVGGGSLIDVSFSSDISGSSGSPNDKTMQKKRKPNMANKTFRDDCDFLFKVLLIGEASVGKTSLMTRYVHHRFNQTYKSTVGIDFESHLVRLDGRLIKLQIWDTAGQEKFKALSPQYYRGADAIVVVYDVSNRHSFDRVLSWVQSAQLQHNAAETVLAIVGNKCDLNSKIREVDQLLGVQIAATLGVDLFMETSAKASVNVGELFEELARKTIAKKKIDLTLHLDADQSSINGSSLSIVRPGLFNTSKRSSSRSRYCC